MNKLSNKFLAVILCFGILLMNINVFVFADKEDGYTIGESGKRWITATETLDDSIRYQRGLFPSLPGTLRGTVDGRAADIPVTWDMGTYDADSTQAGLFIFRATLDDPAGEYWLSPAVWLPSVTFIFTGAAGRARMVAGIGTELSPLIIETAAQLAEIAALVNAGTLETLVTGSADGEVWLKLGADIDLSAYGKNYDDGAGWVPIGTYDEPFKGNFDGGGYIITGLYIDRPSTNHVGLFGRIIGGSITNLGVEGVEITGKEGASAIAGYAKDTDITNCYTTGKVSANGLWGGGIAGDLSTGTMKNCYSLCEVSGYYSSGIAVPGSNGSITNSLALNKSLTGTNSGRISSNVTGTRSGNKAWADMLVNGTTASPDDGTGSQGANITPADLLDLENYPDGFDNDEIWTFEEGSLPGLGGRTVAMPEWLQVGTSEPLGSKDNPYLISTPAQLKDLADDVNGGTSYENKYFKLTADIDLSAYADDDSGAGWVPIGNGTNNFKGHFDGGGYIITGLYIDRPRERLIGLFGFINGGSVTNLGVEGVNIKGNEFVGAIAGGTYNNATITNCYTTGKVSAGSRGGGIAGEIDHDNGLTTIENCYTLCEVSGNIVSGIAGATSETSITNSLALNKAISGSSCTRISWSADGTFSGNKAWAAMPVYNNPATEDDGTGTNGENITPAELLDLTKYPDGFDNEEIWTFASGSLPGLGGRTVAMPDWLNEQDGSEEKPWLISTAEELKVFADSVNAGLSEYVGKYTKLTADIDLSAYGKDYDGGAGWAPIGSLVLFKGHFDGGGYTVTGLYINRPNTTNVGLFGFIDGGSVKNLGIRDAYVKGGDYTGAVVGIISGSLENCWATGTVIGGQYVGGVVGTSSRGVAECWFSGSVSGTYRVGGIVGRSNGVNSSIRDCWSAGAVSNSGESTGGIAGEASGMSNCWSTATVEGKNYTGGIVGYASGAVNRLAALNPGVSVATSSTLVSRAIGDSQTPTFTDIYAYGGMTGTWKDVNGSPNTTKTATSVNGADITPEDYFSASFWTDSDNWGDHEWAEDIWEIVDGKLPTLKNTGGTQTGAGGLYLTAQRLEYAEVTLSSDTYTYNGSEHKPTATVKFGGVELTADTDYAVTYSNNTAAGTATATVTGKGYYAGTKSGEFTIGNASIATATVSVTGTYTYNGSEHKPAATVKLDGKTLTAGTDYELSYSGNVAAGTATVTATGKGNYTGTASGTFTIGKASIATATVSVSGTYTYNGSEHKPLATVTLGGKTLTADTDYELSYNGNVAAGTATVTATGKGNYTGTASGAFTIGKANQTITFAAPTISVAGEAAALGATASSGLSVVYSSNNTAVATVTGGTLTLISAGTVTITAAQPGNDNYNAAQPVSYTLTVTAPEDPGGEDPGGEDPGGEDPGGEDPGGEDPGGEDPGGEDPGGEDPGGEDPGGEDPDPTPPKNPGGDKTTTDDKTDPLHSAVEAGITSALQSGTGMVQIDLSGAGSTVLGQDTLAAIRAGGTPVTFTLAAGISLVLDPAAIGDDAQSIDLGITVHTAPLPGDPSANSLVLEMPTAGAYGLSFDILIPGELLAQSGLTAETAQIYAAAPDGTLVAYGGFRVNADGSLLISVSEEATLYLAGYTGAADGFDGEASAEEDIIPEKPEEEAGTDGAHETSDFEESGSNTTDDTAEVPETNPMTGRMLPLTVFTTSCGAVLMLGAWRRKRG